jgi:dihydrofolate synthase / folylpolyglutamate synthase
VRYPDSVEYLYSLGNEIKTAKFGLENIIEALRSLGNPERAFPVVHVAGTNGKGSTCAMIAAAARAAGMRVGLYTSPHLVEPTERIVIDGQSVTREQFVDAFTRVHEVGMQMETHPTYFETVTAMAFLLFRDESVDLAVVEVGLGGRLDATNVVLPRICAISPIDFDHEAWLGNSLQEIAAEKAGILKPGVPAVIAPQRQEAEEVIRERGRQRGCELDFVRPDEVHDVRLTRDGSEFNFRGMRVRCPLAGPHQVVNATTAAAVLQHIGISANGISEARWPGRLETVRRLPDVILDGAHNPAGARALAAHIREFYSDRPVWLIYGAMRDKSVQEITEILFPLASHVIVTAPNFARALRPEALVATAEHPSIETAENVAEALDKVGSASPDTAIFITGSLYLVGEARALLVK